MQAAGVGTQGQSSQRGQDRTKRQTREVQQEWTAGGQAGQAGRDATGWAVVPGGGHILLELSGRARERHTCSRLVPWLQSDRTEGKAGSQRKEQRGQAWGTGDPGP